MCPDGASTIAYPGGAAAFPHPERGDSGEEGQARRSCVPVTWAWAEVSRDVDGLSDETDEMKVFQSKNPRAGDAPSAHH